MIKWEQKGKHVSIWYSTCDDLKNHQIIIIQEMSKITLYLEPYQQQDTNSVYTFKSIA
jgi:hypothetical protein